MTLPLHHDRTRRKAEWRRWRSLWTTTPQEASDGVHLEIFIAWFLLGYPLLVAMALLLWLIDVQTTLVTPRWIPLGLMAFAVLSGAFHYTRGRSARLTVTRTEQLLAGWPQEVALLVGSLGAAFVVVGA